MAGVGSSGDVNNNNVGRRDALPAGPAHQVLQEVSAGVALHRRDLRYQPVSLSLPCQPPA